MSTKNYNIIFGQKEGRGRGPKMTFCIIFVPKFVSMQQCNAFFLLFSQLSLVQTLKQYVDVKFNHRLCHFKA